MRERSALFGTKTIEGGQRKKPPDFHHEFHEAEMWQSWTPLLPPPNLCEPCSFYKVNKSYSLSPPPPTRHKPLPPSFPPLLHLEPVESRAMSPDEALMDRM